MMCFSLLGRTNVKEVCMKRKLISTLLEYANTNRKEGNFNDVEICVGSDRFPCNRMVLSYYSLFFERMFKTEMKEKYQRSVEIECMEGDTMKSIIEYIYSGVININSENVCKLLSAADYLQIDDLKENCIDFIDKALTPENCFLVIKIADFYVSDKLKNKAMKTIEENFGEASASEEFKILTEHELVNCISKLNKSQVKDTSKIIAIIRWTRHNVENYVGGLTELVHFIDLHKLPVDFFQGVVLEEELVLKNLELCKLCIKVQTKHLNKVDSKETESKVLSVGGTATLSKIIEVFNCTGTPPLAYPAMPESRHGGCAVVLKHTLYFIGGQDMHKQDTNTVWRMNLKRKELKWEKASPMQKKRCVMGTAVFERRLVVAGGGGLTSAECFSPWFNSWSPLTPLQQLREGNSLVLCNDRLYAIGGFGNGQYLSSVECLSAIDGKWEYVAPMQTPRRWLAAVSCNGFIYAIGGKFEDNIQTRLKSVERYDPCQNEWKYITPMKFKRAACAACALQGRIFVVGGMDEKENPVHQIECYDPLFDRWCIVGETAEELYNHSIIVI